LSSVLKEILTENITEARDLACEVVSNLSKDDNNKLLLCKTETGVVSLLVKILREGRLSLLLF
jgi:hypothetical protein